MTVIERLEARASRPHEWDKRWGWADLWLSHTIEVEGQRTTRLLRPMGHLVGLEGACIEDDGATLQGPTMALTPEDAQQLMEDLWQCGIRPRQAAGSVGQLDAVNAHLQDMRRLVFEVRNDG